MTLLTCLFLKILPLCTIFSFFGHRKRKKTDENCRSVKYAIDIVFWSGLNFNIERAAKISFFSFSLYSQFAK